VGVYGTLAERAVFNKRGTLRGDKLRQKEEMLKEASKEKGEEKREKVAPLLSKSSRRSGGGQHLYVKDGPDQ